MTVFSTPYWRKLLEAAVVALIAVLTVPVWAAEGAAVKSAALTPNDEWYQLQAEFDVNIGPALQEALSKGISLNFTVEFELVKPRWYWLDEEIAAVRQNIRLGYHPLTRQYLFSSNAGNKTFTTFAELKNELTRVSDWKVVERAQLKKGTTYEGSVRIKLDVAQLPRPLQVQALGSSEWNLGSDWYHFDFIP